MHIHIWFCFAALRCYVIFVLTVILLLLNPHRLIEFLFAYKKSKEILFVKQLKPKYNLS